MNEVAAAFVRAGDAAMTDGDVAGAQEHWFKAAQADPTSSMPFVRLGDFHLEQGEGEEAIELYKIAVGIEPRDAYAWCRLGRAAYLAGEAEASLLAYEAAFEIAPHDEEVKLQVGKRLIELARVDDGLKVIATIEKLRVENSEVVLAEVAGLCVQGQTDTAVQHLRNAITHFSDPRLLVALAFLLMLQSDFDGAEVLFDKLAGGDLASYEVCLGKAQIEVARGNIVRAKGLLAQAIETDPLRYESYLTLAGIELKGGEPQLAHDIAIAGLGILPDHPDLLFIVALAMRALGANEANVHSILKTITAINPLNQEAWLLYAIVGLNLGNDPTDTRNALQHVVSLDRESSVGKQASDMLKSNNTAIFR